MSDHNDPTVHGKGSVGDPLPSREVVAEAAKSWDDPRSFGVLDRVIWCYVSGRLLDAEASGPEPLPRFIDAVEHGEVVGWCEFHRAAGDPMLDCWAAGIGGQDVCTLKLRLLLTEEEAMRYAYEHADVGAALSSLGDEWPYVDDGDAAREFLAAALGVSDE